VNFDVAQHDFDESCCWRESVCFSMEGFNQQWVSFSRTTTLSYSNFVNSYYYPTKCDGTSFLIMTSSIIDGLMYKWLIFFSSTRNFCRGIIYWSCFAGKLLPSDW
jgi:hypothetical protein